LVYRVLDGFNTNRDTEIDRIMGFDAEELILRPFTEVVEAGNNAVANAEDAADDDPELAERMAKAARAIVREGERALKRLKPIWYRQVDLHGETFKEAILQHGM
jgi:hypothetical protein